MLFLVVVNYSILTKLHEMEFKIDTKDTYTVITPLQNAASENMTALLTRKIEELTNNGSSNYIIDLQNYTIHDNKSLESLTQLQENCYENEQSLVIIGLSSDIVKIIRNDETLESLNVAPTMIEAVDIISMEILERDLFNEEEE